MNVSKLSGITFLRRQNPVFAGQNDIGGNQVKSIFGSSQDRLTISPQGKAASVIEQLLKQKEALKERKSEFIAAGLEEGRTMDSMRPQLEAYEEQMKAIDEQVAQMTAQQTQESMQKTQADEKPENNQPKTEDELEQEKLSAMMNLSVSMEQAKTVDDVRTKTKREGAVLQSEIELDKMNANGLEGAQKMIEKKEEKLEELEDQAQSLTAQVGQALSEIAQEAGEAQTEKTVQTDEKDQSKEQEDPDYLKYSF